MDEIKNERQLRETHYACPECQSGLMKMQFITYFTWLNDELITVPNFPAWVCDLCGRREYDNQAIKFLNALLNPDTGRKPNQTRKPLGKKFPQRPKKKKSVFLE